MKHFVTYIAMDEEIDANILWHAGLLLSQWNDEHDDKIEVVDSYGFYGSIATRDDKSFSYWLKQKLKLDVDFQGNHGWLKRESGRFLDRGYGLHGVTFELTPAQFAKLQHVCKQQLADQEQAVREIAEEFQLEEKQGRFRNYPREHHSAKIFKREHEKSREELRSPRLKPFDFKITFGLTGPSLASAHTCKSHVVDILREVLSDKQIARITENDNHPTIPRFSGKMEPICLHSTGPLSTHLKRNGQTIYFRDQKRDDVKLYWTIPPQEIETINDDTQSQFLLTPKYTDTVKTVVKKLQKLEWFFCTPSVLEELQGDPNSTKYIITQIQKHYQAFAPVFIDDFKKINLDHHQCTASWANRLYCSMFSPPHNEIEAKLKGNSRNATRFLELIYDAVVDDHILEVDEESSDEVRAAAKLCYLSPGNKKKLCDILEWSYIEPLDALIPC